MKQVSYPPFVVFFDTLAAFLFLLMMNQNKTITIEMPQDKIFPGAEVLLKKEDGNYYYARGKGNEQVRTEYAEYAPECEEQYECNIAKNQYSKYGDYSYSILLPTNIFNEISRLNTLALVDKNANCQSIKFVITENGKLDYGRLREDNECLTRLHGFDEMVNKNIQVLP